MVSSDTSSHFNGAKGKAIRGGPKIQNMYPPLHREKSAEI